MPEIKKETTKEWSIGNPVSEVWYFSDEGSSCSFRVLVVQQDILKLCHMDDVDAKMKRYMSGLASWYDSQLQIHINEHFTFLERVMERWDVVAAELEKYWTDRSRPLDGPLMYRQMVGKSRKA
jgi:hypothetical protein